MRDGPLATEASRARFAREIQILAALNHPNIVNVIDRGRTADGSEFFSMEYIAGDPLDLALWNRLPPITPPETKASLAEKSDSTTPLLLFLKICDAVNAAHL